MGKSPDAFRTISEVAELLDVPAHVLRFWESRFTQIKPIKRAGGRRYYRLSDIQLLDGIRRLLHDDGLTIRGVQKLLREDGIRRVAAHGRIDISGAADAAEALIDTSFDEAPMAADVEPEPSRILPFPSRAPIPSSLAEGASSYSPLARSDRWAEIGGDRSEREEPAMSSAASSLSAEETNLRQAAAALEDTSPVSDLADAPIGTAESALAAAPSLGAELAQDVQHAWLADDSTDELSDLADIPPAPPSPRALAEALLATLPADPEDGDRAFALPPLPLGRLTPGLPGLRPLYARLRGLRQNLGESFRRSYSARS